MRPGESFVGQPVRSLQTMLRVLAEDDADLLRVIPDGIFGSQTRNAVSAFQRKYNLPITGVADSLTWERIVAVYDEASVRLLPAFPLQLILNPNQVLRRGDSHPYVLLIQAMLTTMAQIHSSIIAPGLSGVLDAATADAIASFQYMSGLPQTGAVDKITWKNLALQYPLAVNLQESQHRQSR